WLTSAILPGRKCGTVLPAEGWKKAPWPKCAISRETLGGDRSAGKHPGRCEHRKEVGLPTSVFGPEVQIVFDGVSTVRTKQVRVGADTKTIPVPFPSPEDWRDQWIYFLMIDRFNNPVNLPAPTQRNPPIEFDQPFGEFQGGTFEGVRRQLDYIQQLGAGAIWLSPCLKNCPYEKGTF